MKKHFLNFNQPRNYQSTTTTHQLQYPDMRPHYPQYSTRFLCSVCLDATISGIYHAFSKTTNTTLMKKFNENPLFKQFINQHVKLSMSNINNLTPIK